jgi:hypothetical protein
MSFNKKILAFVAAGALTATTAVPAMALENEFHGMFKMMGYYTNVFNGATATYLKKDAGVGNFFEQRARIQYIAKANDNLKLVTHFELDSRFGGLNTTQNTGYKGTVNGNDGGNLDADQLTLETKSVYLDFNCPITGVNVKGGIQPWADSYQSIFLLADMTGVYLTKKFDPLTVAGGWFRYSDVGTFAQTASTTNNASGIGFPAATVVAQPAGKFSNDLFVADAKFAITKDMTVGASYYLVDAGVTTGITGVTNSPFKSLNMFGVNANLKFGPAAVNPFFLFQDGRNTVKNNRMNGFLAGTTAKVKAGPGNVNFAFAYLSGDDRQKSGGKDFQQISANTSYFNAANMWLLVRSGQAVNSSSSVLNNDLTVGGRGLTLITAGYDGAVDKVFYNANVGYAMTSEERTTAGVKEDGTIGTEINAQVGYKMYDNLSISLAGAYAILGEGMHSGVAAKRVGGAPAADNPYMANLQLSYVF